MPVPMLKKLAKKSGKPLSTLEKYWEEAKLSALEKFNKNDNRYWAYVTAIVKQRTGVNESLSFKQFIREETLTEVSQELLNKIKRDCSRFIKESDGHPAFRGVKNQPYYFTKTKDVSSPRDSSYLLSNSLNLFLEQKFGYEAIRSFNRIYVAGEAPQLKQYGDLYYVFPVDKFNFVWSEEVQDATSDFGTSNFTTSIIRYLEKQKMNKDKIKETMDAFYLATLNENGIKISDIKNKKFFKPIMLALDELFEQFNYQNRNLPAALNSGNEIVIQTPAFYSIKVLGNPKFDDPDETDHDDEPPYKYWADARKNYKEIYSRLK